MPAASDGNDLNMTWERVSMGADERLVETLDDPIDENAIAKRRRDHAHRNHGLC
jgi:hypothetical protein